jgi:hypothetical protein
MDILRLRGRGIALVRARELALEQLQTSLDVDVGGVQVSCATVRIKGICNLVVAGLVQSSQIIPNLRDVWVQANGARVGIKSVAILVDLVVEHTN